MLFWSFKYLFGIALVPYVRFPLGFEKKGKFLDTCNLVIDSEFFFKYFLKKNPKANDKVTRVTLSLVLGFF